MMNALGTVNDGEFEKMLKASKALKIKVNRDVFPKSPVVVWKLQGRSFRIVLILAVRFTHIECMDYFCDNFFIFAVHARMTYLQYMPVIGPKS